MATKLFGQTLVCVGIIGIASLVRAGDLDNPAQRWRAKGPGGSPSFTKHIVPLFTKVGCNNRTCHGSFQGQNGFRLSLFGYDAALDHQELTADAPRIRVEPAKPDASLALKKPTGELDHEGGDVLERGSWQHRMFRQWIADGAKYNPKTAVRLERLELLPAELHMATGKSAPLQAIATYSDGAREDVTALTLFSSNDESVADVSESGVVTAKGMGDTAVVAMFGGGVVTSQAIVPRPAAGEFPAFPPHNEVDRLVAAKLEKLGIQPSGLSTDAAFIRRAYVDTIGTFPTPDEVRAFLDDHLPDKRARLIDQLLARPEYALYWATLMSDWTGNNRSNINNALKMGTIWHDWLRDKLARNVPWDELVGGIVTATSLEGRTWEDYLQENQLVTDRLAPRDGYDDGTYAHRKTLDQFWLKRMPDREKGLAIRTANAFLGVQIQCAQCHKHPFDRWTQDDFEGFTSFFRAVTITDLDGTPRSGGRYDYDKVALYVGVEPRYKKLVEQHPPKILGGDVVAITEEKPDPRVALWQWMRSPDNAYFAKNIVNRLWEHYFGVGIVDPVDDQSAASPPSNPQLYDWLARDFIEHGFDLKHLHRRILNSRTYQLSYIPNDSNRTDRRNFSHALVRRLPAEVAQDAIAQVTGTRLVFNNYAAPAGTRAIGLANAERYGRPEYFMNVFGRPKRMQTCACERTDDASLAQALFLINDADIHARISDPKGRLAKLLKQVRDDDALVDELYLTCLARLPNQTERNQIATHIQQSDSRDEAMQDVLWSLLNVREFLFVH